MLGPIVSRKFGGRNFIVLLILAILALSHRLAYPTVPYPAIVRIGLTRYKNATAVSFAADHNLAVASATDGTKIVSAPNNRLLTVVVSNGELAVAKGSDTPLALGKSILVKPVEPDTIISVDCGQIKGRYRSSVEVTLVNGRLRLVNIVGLEDYLLGVVPSEMPPTYPKEALKAQAITARTFTIRNLRRHVAEGFDLCDGEHCQTYSGTGCEREESTQAVKATCGMVLTYKGDLASTMYCADCGGVTQSFGESYQTKDVPYLCSIREPEGTEHCEWERLTTPNEMAALLSRCGAPTGTKLCAAAIKELYSSGRVRSVALNTDAGQFLLSGQQMRSALGLKSTLFAVELTDDGLLRLRGRGYGHGIGLCQVGARSLALPPFNYSATQILAHYFPGTVISQLEKPCGTTSVEIGSTAPARTHPTRPRSQTKANTPGKSEKLLSSRLKTSRL